MCLFFFFCLELFFKKEKNGGKKTHERTTAWPALATLVAQPAVYNSLTSVEILPSLVRW